MSNFDRRSFLKFSLFTAAAALAGCGNDTASLVTVGSLPSSVSLFPGEADPLDLTAPGEMPPTEIPNPQRFFGVDPQFAGSVPVATRLGDTFKHIVVLQLENRSLDNLLGYLYPTDQSPQGQPFNGVATKSFSNPIPSYAPGSGAGSVPVSKATGLLNPVYDPAEQWTAVNLALFNEFNPASNQFAKTEADFQAPYNLPNGGAYYPAPMNGFVTAFYWRLLSANKPANYADYSTVMQCFPPSLIPAISLLAQNYAVCDNWFCAVPSQTYTNRAFFHAASSAGYLVNSPLTRWPLHNDAPTIFESLSNAGRSWTVYYDFLDVLPFTRLLHYPRLKKFPDAAPYFKTMGKFYDDVEAGNLPDYTFIQPRFVLETNSYHPDKGAPAVKRGELLVNDVYQAIRQSNSASGSNYTNTLLVITFDEGGTTYDHVAPPKATQPGDGFAGEYGFTFDRLGQRIPCILVSPWLPPGTVINTPLDANSLIKTLEEKFGLAPLNARDAASTSLMNIPVLSAPRSRLEMPRLQVRKLSADESATDGDKALGDIAEGMVRMVNALANGTDALPLGVTNINTGLDFMQQNRPA